jgi:PmbA protein
MKELHDAAEHALKSFSGGESEVFSARNVVRTVRFANSRIVESKIILDEGIGVRVALNGSVGFSSTTSLEPTDIDRAVRIAEKIASLKKPDPHFKGFPEKGGKTSLKHAADEKIRDLGEEELAGIGEAALKSALEKGPELDVSGVATLVFEECVIKNSLGVHGEDVSSFAYAQVTCEGKNGGEYSGIGWNLARYLEDFKPEEAGAEAAENALKSKGGTTVEAGKYDIVFGHYAVADVLENVFIYAVSLGAVDSGYSYFAGKQGQQVGAESLNVFDDGTIEKALASKQLDDEGIATRKNQLIENGVLKGFLTDSYHAKKLDYHVTGNGFRFSSVPGRRYDSTPGIYPTNLVVEPGHAEEKELIAEVKKGIYLGRTWYTYPINPIQGDFTCTNRGNTFLIEDGKITKPIAANTFRVTDNFPKLLNQIKGIGKKTKSTTLWGGVSAISAPEIVFENVNVIYSKGEQLKTE